jgi:hypothetical protein
MKDSEIVNDENARKFGKAYIKEIVKALKETKKSASGRLINSFSEEIKETAQGINIIILSEDYLEFIDKGRKRGTWPNISAIKKWTSLKGIKPEAAFPIAKNIYKFGIKPTNVLDKADRRAMNSSAFTELEQDIANNIEDLIIKKLDENLDIKVSI